MGNINIDNQFFFLVEFLAIQTAPNNEEDYNLLAYLITN